MKSCVTDFLKKNILPIISIISLVISIGVAIFTYFSNKESNEIAKEANEIAQKTLILAKPKLRIGHLISQKLDLKSLIANTKLIQNQYYCEKLAKPEQQDCDYLWLIIENLGASVATCLRIKSIKYTINNEIQNLLEDQNYMPALANPVDHRWPSNLPELIGPGERFAILLYVIKCLPFEFNGFEVNAYYVGLNTDELGEYHMTSFAF